MNGDCDEKDGKIREIEKEKTLLEYCEILLRSLSSGYCLLLISIYLVIIVNNFTQNSNTHYFDVEPTALFLYLTSVSSIFLVYMMIFLTRPPRSHMNRKSHGSAFLRQGAVIFGAGSVIFFAMDSASHSVNFECIGSLRTTTGFFTIIFYILQIIAITFFPRLNLDPGAGAAHFGLMHLVATNLVIWAKTVVKESFLEYHEIKEEEELHKLHGHEHGHHNLNMSDLHSHLVKRHTHTEIEYGICKDTEHFEFIFNLLRASTPILFAFIIEFSLIGATVFYNMWTHIEYHHKADTSFDNISRRPKVKALLRKTDWSHSSYGAVAGIIIFIFNSIALGAFFHWSSLESFVDEYLEKVMRSLTNSVGIIAAIFGCVQIRKMVLKKNKEDFSVDRFLLNLGGAFTFVYMSFSISIGLTSRLEDSFPCSLITVNGILSICQITIQIVFINLILDHVTKRDDISHPGRQMTTFLVLINFSLWFVNTFELQKSQASQVESEVYGAITWVWLQRLTLPIVIFFRFHSTVVLIDCWKNSYRMEEY